MKIPYILLLYIALEKEEKMPYYPVRTSNGLTNMIFDQNLKECVGIQLLRGFWDTLRSEFKLLMEGSRILV